MAAIDIAREVLIWFRQNDSRLTEHLSVVQVSISEVTRCGFIASLALPENVEVLAVPWEHATLCGCDVFCDNLDTFADCLLQIRDRNVRSLKIYSVTDSNPAEASAFHVRSIDDNQLDQRQRP